MMNLLGTFLGIFLVLLPLVFWQWAKIPYEIPKVWFVQRYIEFLAILTLICLPKLKTKSVNLKLVSILTVWLTVVILSSAFGVNPAKSLMGNYYRGDGLLTLFHLVGFALIIALFWEEKWKSVIAKSIVFGSTIVSSWILLDAVRLFILKDPSITNWSGALGGPFGQPVFLAGYLLVALPFSVYLLSTVKKNRNIVLISMIVQIMGIILTRSLASALGLILLFSLIFGLWKRKVKVWLAILLIVFAAAFVVLSYWWKSLHASEFVVAEGRERIFMKLVLAAKNKPVLGYGWANVDYAFDSSVWPIKFNNDVYVDKAHSHLLESLVTTGIAGFVSYVLLLSVVTIKFLKGYLKHKSEWSVCLLAAFLIFVFHSQTNIISISEELIFWLLIGIALKKQDSPEKE